MLPAFSNVRAGTAPFDTPWPGTTPEFIAPGVVNTDGIEINLVFDRHGREFFFSRMVEKVFFVYTSRLVNGTWTAPERLKLYPDGGWTEPKNMGPAINTETLEFCPMVSPDGRWLSFSRRYGESWPTTTDAEIHWMDASIIEDLRED